MKSLTLGAAPDNDLVIDAPGVAPLHARARLDVEGYVWLDEVDPAHPVRIRRSGHWLRIRRATICAGDDIRLGERDINLPALTAALGEKARLRSARLGAARHRVAEKPGAMPATRISRDPVTGDIHEVHEANKETNP